MRLPGHRCHIQQRQLTTVTVCFVCGFLTQEDALECFNNNENSNNNKQNSHIGSFSLCIVIHAIYFPSCCFKKIYSEHNTTVNYSEHIGAAVSTGFTVNILQ